MRGKLAIYCKVCDKNLGSHYQGDRQIIRHNHLTEAHPEEARELAKAYAHLEETRDMVYKKFWQPDPVPSP